MIQILNKNNFFSNIELINRDLFILSDKLKKLFMFYLSFGNDSSFLLKKDNNLIGLFLSCIINCEAYIANIFISEKYRKKGYGRLVLEKGLNILSDKCSKIYLEVNKNNIIAINLYKKFNFNITNEIYTYKNDININKIENFINLQYQNVNPFLFFQLYKLFHKNFCFNKKYLILKSYIEQEKSNLLQILYNNKIIGYIIFNRNNNIFEIIDISLLDNYFELIPKIIFDLIKNEQIIIIKQIIKNEKINKLLVQYGFYIDNEQLEMIFFNNK